MVGKELRAPIDHAAAAVWRHFDRAAVLGHGHPGDVGVAKAPPHVVDRLESFDYFSAIERFDGAELPDSCTRHADSRIQGMPGAAEVSDHRPYLVGRCRDFDGLGDGLQLRVRSREIRKY